MSTIGLIAIIVGVYSLIMLRKVENKTRIYDNMNAYVGAVLMLLLGMCLMVRESGMEELLKQLLIYLICLALSVIFILYGILLVTVPIFFRTQVEGKLVRYNIKMEKNHHGCFAYVSDGQIIEAESEKISKSKRLKKYEEGKNYPIWVNSKYADMCRVNRYKECFIGAVYLVAGSGLFIRVITLL